MTASWVIGSGGLLGSSLSDGLRGREDRIYLPPSRLAWGNPGSIRAQFSVAADALSAMAQDTAQWRVYWAAGVGTMAAAERDLQSEGVALEALLDVLEQHPGLRHSRGLVVLASSAGALYAGSPESVSTERTLPSPTTAYAREKLRQESLVNGFVQRSGGRHSALVARISTLYGPRQARGKQQGLISNIARQLVRNRPIQVFVPFDTIRDYVFATDAARKIIAAGDGVLPGMGARIKIIASERVTTVSEIIATFRRLSRRSLRVVTSASPQSALYARKILFRSDELPTPQLPAPTPLAVGIARVLQAERVLHAMEG